MAWCQTGTKPLYKPMITKIDDAKWEWVNSTFCHNSGMCVWHLDIFNHSAPNESPLSKVLSAWLIQYSVNQYPQSIPIQTVAQSPLIIKPN